MSYQFSTTTSYSDETYLESFVESISASLPNELRRNLEHLRDLDRTSYVLMEEWRERQDDCLKGVEKSLTKAFRKKAAAAIASNANADDADADAAETSKENPPRSGKKRKRSPSPDRKVACQKCRARKVKCDGKQPFCLFRGNDDGSSSDDNEDEGDENDDSERKEVKSPSEKKGDEREDDERQNNTPLSESEISTILQTLGPPTEEELLTALRTYNPQFETQRREISDLSRELRQYSDEKISTAQQIKSMVDMALGRLNRDLEIFEEELGIVTADNAGASNGTNATVDGAGRAAGSGIAARGGASMDGRRNDGASGGRSSGAVAAHPTGASTGSTSHHRQSNTAPRRSSAAASSAAGVPPLATAAASSTAIKQQKQQPLLPPILYPPATTAAATARGILPPPPKSITTANLAAIQINPTTSPDDWILAKILSHDKSTKTYTLSDEDILSNQIYKMAEKHVVPLKDTEKNKWQRGDNVYAVYPDTTSLYHATVSTPPWNGFVMVQFKDDGDVDGVTHEKAVAMAHVMKVPGGRK